MGNALGCAGLGERLAAAARDGDAAEARRLVAANPGLARCAAFGSLNSPLHLAAAKGHHEIAALLLENGADVNARNIYGQTALMQACRFGHWEVVQTLLVFRCNVSKVDSVSSRTALHVAAAGGHVKCARLLLAAGDGGGLVNRAASGGVTALHLAALHGHVDCVHLLVDEHADLAAPTLPSVASPMGSIGARSTPLHYAAAGGEVKCCQILVSRGADRTAVNCNGWLPVDVARTWGCHWLEHVLSPKSHLPIPKFPPSGYLSSPLASVLGLARECGLVLSSSSPEFLDGGVDESDACAVCLERPCNVAAEVCGHELCVKCALDLCSVIKSYDVPGIAGSIPCPLCRSGIASFRKRAASDAQDDEADPDHPMSPACSGSRRNRGNDGRASPGLEKKPAVDSDAILPLYCSPYTPTAVLS